MIKMKQLFVHCSCYSEGLEVSQFDDEKEVQISIWALKRSTNTLPWRERFRWVWHILKSGDPHSDMIILSQEDAIKVKNFLEEVTK